MTDDQVFALICELNPVVDLASITVADVGEERKVVGMKGGGVLIDERAARIGSARGLAAALLAAVVVTAVVAFPAGLWWARSDSTQPALDEVPELAAIVGDGPGAVVDEFIERRARGRLVEALELMTPDAAEANREFYSALVEWNLRGVPMEPCVELTSSDPGTGRYQCTIYEVNDFHDALGLGAWTSVLIVAVDENGMISSVLHSTYEWEDEVAPANSRFTNWIRDAHPEVAEQFPTPVMGSKFDAEMARTALQFVDEFVGQDDRYPPPASDDPRPLTTPLG